MFTTIEKTRFKSQYSKRLKSEHFRISDRRPSFGSNLLRTRCNVWNSNKFVRISDVFALIRLFDIRTLPFGRSDFFQFTVTYSIRLVRTSILVRTIDCSNRLVRTRVCSVFGIYRKPNVWFSDVDCTYLHQSWNRSVPVLFYLDHLLMRIKYLFHN